MARETFTNGFEGIPCMIHLGKFLKLYELLVILR